jgi:succinate dehydrogenase/fumarate reductase flavoprotein subunit
MGIGWVNKDGVDVMRRFGESEAEFTRRLSLGHAVALEMLEGRSVFLDGSRLTPDKVRLLWDVIPIIMQTFENAGYEITRDRIPYIPVNASTYGSSHGGGAVVNEKSETSLPGLFAAGASSDGMNISPNLNLSWCMVLGWWAGEHAASYAKKNSLQEIKQDQIEDLSQKALKYLNGDGLTFNDIHSKAAQVLIDLGVVTSDEKLSRARESLMDLLSSYDRVKAHDRHDLVKIVGLRNSLEALTVILQYLLHRKESRGSVINSDHPETDNRNWLTLTKSQMTADGQIKLWDDPIPRDEFYVHYRPKPGTSLHPFFKVVGRQVDEQRQ